MSETIELNRAMVQGLRNGLGVLEMDIDCFPDGEDPAIRLQRLFDLVHEMEDALDTTGVKFTRTPEDDEAGVPVMARLGDCEACGERAVWGIEKVSVQDGDDEMSPPVTLDVCPECVLNPS